MRRQVLTTIVMLLLAAALTACGGKETEESQNTVLDEPPVVSGAQEVTSDMPEYSDGEQDELTGHILSIDGDRIKLNRAVTTVEDDGSMTMTMAVDDAVEEADLVTVELKSDAVFTIRQMEADLIHSKVTDASRKDLALNQMATLLGFYGLDGTFEADSVEIFKMP